jgi:uncharacterized protein YndB with AHSA1/START domain
MQMGAIVTSVEIERPQSEVFAYVTDPSKFSEWQAGVESGSTEDGATPKVGSTCITMRRVGASTRQVTSRVTQLDPPRSWGVRGINGPVRATVDVTIEPVNISGQSRVTIAVDFEGHGIGKLLVPLFIRRQAGKEMPANCRKLKQLLEAVPDHSAA